MTVIEYLVYIECMYRDVSSVIRFNLRITMKLTEIQLTISPGWSWFRVLKWLFRRNINSSCSSRAWCCCFCRCCFCCRHVQKPLKLVLHLQVHTNTLVRRHSQTNLFTKWMSYISFQLQSSVFSCHSRHTNKPKVVRLLCYFIWNFMFSHPVHFYRQVLYNNKFTIFHCCSSCFILSLHLSAIVLVYTNLGQLTILNIKIVRICGQLTMTSHSAIKLAFSTQNPVWKCD